MTAEHNSSVDPCAGFGPDQRWAVVWFFAILFIGAVGGYTLCKTDAYNYRTNGEFFDFVAYRSNRVGWTHIQNEGVDERAHGDYATAAKKLGS